ncbi:hypothetical protein OC844_008096, partial [Tilletia horrida]
LCKWAFHVDVIALGLEEMRTYPEIVPTRVWSIIHVLMDMLFFLIVSFAPALVFRALLFGWH